MSRIPSLLIPLLALLLLPAGALGGATSPKISLSLAEGIIADGARSVRMEGFFDFEDALQTGYSLHLLVYQGTLFARFPVSATSVTGTSSALSDGTLDEDEVDGFLLDGAPAPPGIRIARFTPDRALVTLPAGFGAGQTTAIIMAIINEGVVFSNPLIFTLP